MNELEMVTSKICSAREIIDVAAEAAQNHDYNRAETMATAAYEFLGYYLEEFDKKFKDAWEETVTALNKETKLTCDKDDSSPECRSAWSSFWESEEVKDDCMPPWGHSDLEYASKHTDYVNEIWKPGEITEKLMETIERDGFDYTPLPSKNSYAEMIEAGYTMTADGFWIPPESKKKWLLPVQCADIHDADSYYVNFPDDLLAAANLKEGDEIEWIDNKDGSATLRKIIKSTEMEQSNGTI